MSLNSSVASNLCTLFGPSIDTQTSPTHKYKLLSTNYARLPCNEHPNKESHNIKYLEESSRLSESTRRIGNVIAQNSPSGKFYVQLRNKLRWWPSEGHTHGNSIIKTAQVQGRFTQRCYYKGATSVTTKENSLNLSPTPGLTPQRLNYVKVSSLSPSTVSPSSMLLNSR